MPTTKPHPIPTHTHYCGCGDHRVCSKPFCVPGTLAHSDAWVCPDCEVTEKLEALQQAEEKRLCLQMLSSHPTVDFVNEVVTALAAFQSTTKGEQS
jgi:hypothetical protein